MRLKRSLINIVKVQNFQPGYMSTSGAEHYERPVESTAPEIIDKVHDPVMDDRRVKLREIASAVGISKERVIIFCIKI